jgi:hypothetical protein
MWFTGGSVTSADLSEFKNGPRRPNKTPTCNVELLKRIMSTDQRERFEAALADDTISTTTVAQVVAGWADWPFELRPTVVARHRRGMRGEISGCCCGRS